MTAIKTGTTGEAVSYRVAAAMLQVDYWRVRYLVRSGKLTAVFRADGHRYVSRESVEAYGAARRAAAVTA